MQASIYIRNMVCDRCKASVENILQELDIDFREIRLGEVYLNAPMREGIRSTLAAKLEEVGFELLQDRDSRTINRIKTEVLRIIRHNDFENQNLSAQLSVHLNKEYSSLSKLFSQVEGRTIESYYIDQRIEYVKELIVYNELSLSEIADKTHYSSVAHLSAQFKKITGMTPTQFRKLGSGGRKKLDEV